MKPILRIAILGVTAVLCGWALVRWVYVPFWCMREIAAIGGGTLNAEREAIDVTAATLARENLRRARILEERCPASLHAFLLEAANEQILGGDEDAIRTLRRSLTVARRPEIYFALGTLLVRVGRIDEAVEEYATGGDFNRSMIETIDAAELRRRVRERIAERERASRQMK